MKFMGTEHASIASLVPENPAHGGTGTRREMPRKARKWGRAPVTPFARLVTNNRETVTVTAGGQGACPGCIGSHQCPEEG